MKTRTDLLNHLVEKYNLQRYLEIGVQVPELNFDKIKCQDKISVDPDPRATATFCKTSDEFFDFWLAISGDKIAIPSTAGMGPILKDEHADLMALLRRPRFSQQVFSKYFDLIFIDGLHTAEQVKKDFENALKILSPNGFIVLHDLLPENYERTIIPRPTKTGSWNGDCYKFAVKLYKDPNFHVVSIDNGCGIYHGNNPIIAHDAEIGWDEFQEDKNLLYNIINWEEFCKLYDGRILERY